MKSILTWISRGNIRRIALAVALSLLAGSGGAWAAGDSSIAGTVVDGLGARISSARVALFAGGQHVADTTTDAEGFFTFPGLAEGRYRVAAGASGFESRATDAFFVSAGARAVTEVRLSIGALEQQVFVTASATEVPEAQAGAPATAISLATLERLGNTDLLEVLRSVPGVQIVQTGGRGGPTSLSIRGGSSNFNKVLLDGVPANDIGGAFDFADLATTGVDRVEVLRGSNSVLYGSDALTGVVSISTRRGQSRLPEVALSLDAGNFGTGHADVSLGGTASRFDYFIDGSHLQTDNDVPNSAYRNKTFVTRLGAAIGAATSLSATLRRVDATTGSPNAVAYYGLSDDSAVKKDATFASLTAQSQIASRWQGTIRFGSASQNYHVGNPRPTGEAYDPFGFGANYLGKTVTIAGANGYSVTGRAVLDYGGTYPSNYDSHVTRQVLNGDTSYQFGPALALAGGVRIEHANGTAQTTSVSETTRNDYGSFVEMRATLGTRLYAIGGVGADHNEIFGSAVTPRVSVAAYLRAPSASMTLGETKVTFNAGKGIKEPSLPQELSSLFSLLPPANAASLKISPIGPERSRNVDVGIEQGFSAGRGRARLAYFNNDFADLIEFVSKTVLPKVGVPVAAAAATPFGAYLNSQSNRSRGVEASGDAVFGPLRVSGTYMHLNAVVTASVGSGALSPAINPAFPGIQIGVYSPLVGARPFRRPANSGSVAGSYTRKGAVVSIAGYFFGKQDDSTFLTDQDFGNSMLLPNKDLDPAYQKIDLSGSYRIHPRLRWYLTLENLFDEQYQAAAGFPALSRSVRTGVTVTFAGDRTP